jgi:hypothetical protein
VSPFKFSILLPNRKKVVKLFKSIKELFSMVFMPAKYKSRFWREFIPLNAVDVSVSIVPKGNDRLRNFVNFENV